MNPGEFEEFVSDLDVVEISCSSGYPIAFGCTLTGNSVACACGELNDGITVMPITACEVES